MRKGNLLLLLLIVCFTSCEMLESHPYDAHITGERGINAKNCERIEEAMKGKKTFRFAMISDTQRWYDETEKVVEKINERGDIDFVLHGGDQSDFGATKEFLWMRDIMKGFQMPFVCVLGNHDSSAREKMSIKQSTAIPTLPLQPEMFVSSASIPMQWNMTIHNLYPILDSWKMN